MAGMALAICHGQSVHDIDSFIVSISVLYNGTTGTTSKLIIDSIRRLHRIDIQCGPVWAAGCPHVRLYSKGCALAGPRPYVIDVRVCSELFKRSILKKISQIRIIDKGPLTIFPNYEIPPLVAGHWIRFAMFRGLDQIRVRFRELKIRLRFGMFRGPWSSGIDR